MGEIYTTPAEESHRVFLQRLPLARPEQYPLIYTAPEAAPAFRPPSTSG